MPRHPNAIQKWNYVVEFWVDPCDAPLSIYVRTLFPAILEALVTIYAIDVMQIFTGFVRPGGPLKGTRGGRHGGRYEDPDVARRRRSRPKGAKRTWLKAWRVWSGFDPSEWLGSSAAKALGIGGRTVTPGVQTLWNLYGLQQFAVYSIFMAEVVNEFFYTWSSGVAQSEYCQEQYRPWVYCEAADVRKLGAVFEDPLPFDVVVKARGAKFAAGNVIGVEGNASACVFTGTYADEPPDEEIFIRVRHSSGVQFDSAPIRVKGGRYSVAGSATTEGSWAFLGVGGTRFTLTDVEFSVIGSEPHYGPGEV